MFVDQAAQLGGVVGGVDLSQLVVGVAQGLWVEAETTVIAGEENGMLRLADIISSLPEVFMPHFSPFNHKLYGFYWDFMR